MKTIQIGSRTATITHAAPDVAYFIELRETCGWGRISTATATAALAASAFNVSVSVDGRPAGFGRVVGDGSLAFYIQDVVIDESARGLGLGRAIIEELIDLILTRAAPGASIGLMSALGKEDFYRKFGFIGRPEEGRDLGAGMSRFVTTGDLAETAA